MTGRSVGLHSGVDFDVEPEIGLCGACDFIVTRSPTQLFVAEPIIVVAEAKAENMTRAYAQCVAEMVAVQRFDDSEGTPRKMVYGAVTYGVQWKFLALEGSAVRIDAADYFITELGTILGILRHMATE